MKIISLWQPWASLVSVGAKGFETRSWHTSHRGPLGIHAASKAPKTFFNQLSPKFIDAARDALGIVDFDELPRGCILSVGDMRDCWKIRDGELLSIKQGIKSFGEISPTELLFGDYTPERFAWELADMLQLPRPIPAKGKQGLWNWEGQ